ncbi:MAG TPA: shikimate dehydrogenase [Planctomycetaceae bacterium]|nr:shikimate dehydrogenase [Planctomycetaceae bacterium]
MPRIDAKTKVCAVIGHPIGHSLSPELHNAAFEALELPYVYVAHDVEPGQVQAALEGVRALGYRGLSVTIPHKVEAMHAVDEIDETALGIGCINTIVNESGRLFGTNSDGLGALGALRDAGADPEGRCVVILGSGGAARAIAITLAREAPPKHITILGIEMEQLERLVADVRQRGRSEDSGEELTDESLRRALDRAELLLHCSPVGMHPKEGRSLVPPELLRSELVVFDAVYNPRRTRLLQDAAAAGCRTVEGIEMFLGQAYVQFELWTGLKAPRDVMRRVVEARL